MAPATAKALKIGGIIILVFVVLFSIYYFTKGSTAKFTAFPGKDVTPGVDMECKNGLTLAEAEKHATTIGAGSFFRFDDTTCFKKATGPQVSAFQTGTLYVKS